MKKLICLMSLMLVAALAWAQPEPKVEPQGYDVGIVENAAVVEMNGMALTDNYQYVIVDWQAPAMLEGTSEMAAQVVDAIIMPTTEGEISMTLAALIWPNSTTDAINYSSDISKANYNDRFSPGEHMSFTPALTVI